MIFNKTLLFILFTLGLSCSPSKNKWDLSGEYANKTYSLIEKILLQANNATYVLHSKIVLNQDSTYIYTTCGTEMKGIWNVKNDSLILNCKQNKYHNDSINKIRPPSCGTKPIIFLIDYNKKELKEMFYQNEKRVLNYFSKIK